MEKRKYMLGIAVPVAVYALILVVTFIIPQFAQSIPVVMPILNMSLIILLAPAIAIFNIVMYRRGTGVLFMTGLSLLATVLCFALVYMSWGLHVVDMLNPGGETVIVMVFELLILVGVVILTSIGLGITTLWRKHKDSLPS